MKILKPLQGEPLTFWHVGGDVIWRGDGRCTPITREMADSLRELYGEETDAAWLAKDRPTAKRAARLWLQITHAIDAQDTWFRVIGCEPRKAA